MEQTWAWLLCLVLPSMSVCDIVMWGTPVWLVATPWSHNGYGQGLFNFDNHTVSQVHFVLSLHRLLITSPLNFSHMDLYMMLITQLTSLLDKQHFVVYTVGIFVVLPVRRVQIM